MTVAALSFVVAPAAQAATVTVAIDCTNLQSSTTVEALAGDQINISIINCDSALAWGGTGVGVFADYVDSDGEIVINGVANNWSAMLGSTPNQLMLLIRGNHNESRNDSNAALTTGASLFTMQYNSNYYSWIIGEVPGGEEVSSTLGKVTFGAYSITLTKSAQKKLKAIGRAALQANATELLVSGFTAKGANQTWSETQRVALAKARANAVKDFLSAWFEAKDANVKITVKAVGSKKPLKPNTSEDNRSKNRRVEVKIKAQIV